MKDTFLQAALKLAGAHGRPSALTVADVLAASGGSAQDFAKDFADLPAFQRELASLLFAQAREAVIATTAGMQSGLEQLTTAFIAYLDHNLRQPALQELAHHIQYTPDGLDLLARMETGVALVAQADLAAMRPQRCAEHAKLLTALVVCVVRAEYKAQRALPAMRETLMDYCRFSVEH